MPTSLDIMRGIAFVPAQTFPKYSLPYGEIWIGRGYIRPSNSPAYSWEKVIKVDTRALSQYSEFSSKEGIRRVRAAAQALATGYQLTVQLRTPESSGMALYSPPETFQPNVPFYD